MTMKGPLTLTTMDDGLHPSMIPPSKNQEKKEKEKENVGPHPHNIDKQCAFVHMGS
jgi:hypothetical protein